MSEVKNIRISIRADEVSNQLVELGYFSTQIDCYRAAIAISISKDLPSVSTAKLELNKWDTAAVFKDPKSHSISLIELFYSTDKPVETGMGLAENGLEYIDQQRLSGHDLWKIILDASAVSV